MFYLQVFLKFIFVHNISIVNDVMEFIANIYSENSKSQAKHYEMCQKYAPLSQLILKVWGSVYFTIFQTAIAISILEYLITGDMKPFMHIYIPGIDNYSATGFTMLLVLNYILGVCCFFTLIPIDSTFFVIFANFPMISTILTDKLNELNASLENVRKSPRDIHLEFISLIAMHRKYIE